MRPRSRNSVAALCLCLAALLLSHGRSVAEPSRFLKRIKIIGYSIAVEETNFGTGCRIDEKSLATALQFVANQSTNMHNTLAVSFISLLAMAATAAAASCYSNVDAEGRYSPTMHVQCLRQQAEQGDADAQYQLGLWYMVGEEPLTQDYEEAVKWFRRSTNQGFAGSQFKLATMYWAGKGVKRDAVQAHMWANLAAAQGMKMAEGARMIAEEQMTSAQVLEAQRMAREWKPKPER
jgi:uncharacterized protein